MTFVEKLDRATIDNNSLLCVGLDPDLDRIPPKVRSSEQSLFEFSKAIIDATKDLVCAYKPNSAFFEAFGSTGIEQLKKTVDYIKQQTDIAVILDAKRADIGSTNAGYIKFAFEYLNADAITLHPYLGQEAMQPFLDYKDKGLIVLCRTSNPGGGEFQDLETDGRPLYQAIADRVANHWDKNGNCSLVVGATYPEELKAVRSIVGPEMNLLIPGVGAQGGDVQQTVKAGINNKGSGIIINSSRGIIFASNGEDFAEAARTEAQKLRDEINKYRK